MTRVCDDRPVAPLLLLVFSDGGRAVTRLKPIESDAAERTRLNEI